MPTEGITVSMPGYDWDTIYHLEASFKKCWIKDFSDTPCVLYRGAVMRHLNFTPYIINQRFSSHQGYQKILLIHIGTSFRENPR
jgi:hypothetical protein